jgi:hypothetical protein
MFVNREMSSFRRQICKGSLDSNVHMLSFLIDSIYTQTFTFIREVWQDTLMFSVMYGFAAKFDMLYSLYDQTLQLPTFCPCLFIDNLLNASNFLFHIFLAFENDVLF